MYFVPWILLETQAGPKLGLERLLQVFVQLDFIHRHLLLVLAFNKRVLEFGAITQTIVKVSIPFLTFSYFKKLKILIISLSPISFLHFPFLRYLLQWRKC